jgi:A/G-specific adenine glycosylase
VVDGNVFRCISRYFDVETDIALASAKNCSTGSRLMPKDDPATFNQAGFGALQCVPKSPDCCMCF